MLIGLFYYLRLIGNDHQDRKAINESTTHKMKDTYRTLSAPSEGDFKDRGSKFITYAYPVYSEADWQDALTEVRKLHPKARHFCYAYRLGLSGNQYRANDDGEPSGTAGKPMLGQIDSFDLTNVFVVCVRYFGGTLLGTSGLINAYRAATRIAFEAGDIIERTVEDIYRLTFDYALMSNVMNAIKKENLEMVKKDFGVLGIVDIAIRQSEVESKLDLLRAGIAGTRIEEVPDLEDIEGLEMDFIETR